MILRRELGPWFECFTYVGKNENYVKDVFCKNFRESKVCGGVFFRPDGMLFQRHIF